MVGVYGWIEEENYNKYPKEEWCDMDYMAVWIRSKGYNPKTTMENLILMIFGYYYDDDNVKENGYFAIQDEREYPDNLMVNIPDVEAYIEASGGLQEFDFEA